MGTNILLVEDDPSLGFVIKDNLTMRGYTVTLCTDGDEGRKSFFGQHFDLCILDVMMPKTDGITLAKIIRGENKQIPILFVTAKSMLEDKVLGFNSGGDDYIVKPFSIEELCLRIEVFLRRTVPSDVNPQIFLIGCYTFDYPTLALRHPHGSRALTQKEADVLRLLCLHQDRVLKREEILRTVWGNDDYFLGRSLDVFLSKLRKYLKEDPAIEIANYHGVGFRLEVSKSA